MLVKNNNFNHLKVHTQYSICEGAIKIDQLKDFCKKNQRCFYISNDFKLAQRINANGVYISSTNNNLNLKTINLKKKFRILGSAHNLKEIKIKELN